MKKVTVIGAPLTVEQGESLAIKVVVRNAGLLDAAASTLTFRLVSTGVTPPGLEELEGNGGRARGSEGHAL